MSKEIFNVHRFTASNMAEMENVEQQKSEYCVRQWSFGLFVTPNGEGTVRNISEWHKICKDGGLEKKTKEETEKLRLQYI